jgi:redox-sensitive bicupin YhaK (pirin superfamily)
MDKQGVATAVLVSEKPLEEPVAWYSLIVMNTQSNFGRLLPNFKREPS